MPVSRQTTADNPFNDQESDGGETPLYARSDWDATTDGGGVTPGRTPRKAHDDELETEASAWSRSSFAGMTTGVPFTGRRTNTLGDILEEGHEDEYAPHTAQSAQTGWYGEEMVMSPGAMTATPRTAPSPYSAYDPQTRQSGYTEQRKSTLPSVLELEDLVKGNQAGESERGARQRAAYQAQPTPDHLGYTYDYDAAAPDRLASGMEIMTPDAHQRLGRMSVAPARNQDDQDEYWNEKDVSQEGQRNLAQDVKSAMAGRSGVVKGYLIYRPFISTILTIVAALLVTISLQNNPGKISRYIVLKDGSFAVYPSGVGDVGLGANGWCQVNG